MENRTSRPRSKLSCEGRTSQNKLSLIFDCPMCQTRSILWRHECCVFISPVFSLILTKMRTSYHNHFLIQILPQQMCLFQWASKALEGGGAQGLQVGGASLGLGHDRSRPPLHLPAIRPPADVIGWLLVYRILTTGYRIRSTVYRIPLTGYHIQSTGYRTPCSPPSPRSTACWAPSRPKPYPAPRLPCRRYRTP